MLSRERRPRAGRLNEAREDEDEKRYQSGNEAINTERLDDECLYESKIKRSDDPDKRDSLEYSAQEPVEDDELKSGEDKKNAEEKDAVFGERYAEEFRIFARGDNIAPREVLYVADKRFSLCLLLSQIRGIRDSQKGEEQYGDDADTLHTERIRALGLVCKQNV